MSVFVQAHGVKTVHVVVECPLTGNGYVENCFEKCKT